ncbi:MAG: hypothetical protein CSA95_00435 [Bacteroidetes bacterium]|nr:MAG: hypothetical protein CSA95_00435 [Bacteroidota bacterium]
MIVHKFGGASIKDAASIRHLAVLIKTHVKEGGVIVLSAIGKTTNALEEVTYAAFSGEERWKSLLKEVEAHHLSLCDALFPENPQVVEREILSLFHALEEAIRHTETGNFNRFYDTVVSYGERIGSTLVWHFLKASGLPITQVPATETLITDHSFREARINWEATSKAVTKAFPNPRGYYLTQGFIAGTPEGAVTTLGREGSDFSAAVIANILHAKEVWIWKDVNGLYNADPHRFPQARLLPKATYTECMELAYYGAQVVHPRTLAPLQQKRIPLHIHSFKQPENGGTTVTAAHTDKIEVPCTIIKEKQCLITLTPKQIGFMTEEYLEKIIALFKEHSIRINLLQSSAVNLTLCFDDDPYRFHPLQTALKATFEVRYNRSLSLLTVVNYVQRQIADYSAQKTIYLTQQSRRILRLVYR